MKNQLRREPLTKPAPPKAELLVPKAQEVSLLESENASGVGDNDGAQGLQGLQERESGRLVREPIPGAQEDAN